MLSHLVKKYLHHVILISYIIYLSFIPVTISHSIILVSLVGLFAYSEYLLRLDTPDVYKELAQLKMDMESHIVQQKEATDAKLAEVSNELGKLNINFSQRPSSSSIAKPTHKKLVF